MDTIIIKVKGNEPATPEQEVEMWMMLYDIATRSQSIVDMLQEEIEDCYLVTIRLWDKL